MLEDNEVILVTRDCGWKGTTPNPFILGNLGATRRFFQQNGDGETGGFLEMGFQTGFYFCQSLSEKVSFDGACVRGHMMSVAILKHLLICMIATYIPSTIYRLHEV